jgi:hypothetical protein
MCVRREADDSCWRDAARANSLVGDFVSFGTDDDKNNKKKKIYFFILKILLHFFWDIIMRNSNMCNDVIASFLL